MRVLPHVNSCNAVFFLCVRKTSMQIKLVHKRLELILSIIQMHVIWLRHACMHYARVDSIKRNLLFAGSRPCVASRFLDSVCFSSLDVRIQVLNFKGGG